MRAFLLWVLRKHLLGDLFCEDVTVLGGGGGACVTGSDTTDRVDVEAEVLVVIVLRLTSLVPELVEEHVVVLASLRRFNHSVQVLLRDNANDLRPKGLDLNEDKFLPRLNRLVELEVEAPGHEDHLDEHDVQHVCPAHTLRHAELLGVVRHHPEVKRVRVTLLQQL